MFYATRAMACSLWAVAAAVASAAATTGSPDAPLRLVEVTPHHQLHQDSQANRQEVSDDIAGSPGMMRRQVARSSPRVVSVDSTGMAAFDERQLPGVVQWGDYPFTLTPGSAECIEPPAANPGDTSTWETASSFGLWADMDAGIKLEGGTVNVNGQATEVDKGLRIYKAACSNATAVSVGATTPVPPGVGIVDIVFAITRWSSGDSVPFKVALLGANDVLLHQWCWNRQGTSATVTCHTNFTVPPRTWQRITLNISEYYVTAHLSTQYKLELGVYTDGDYRYLPATGSPRGGVGGRAMVLLDTFIFHPSQTPAADSSYTGVENSFFCRESHRDVCPPNSWCFNNYRCQSGHCIEGRGRCNGLRNCGPVDDSDEVGCEYAGGLFGEFFFSHGHFIDTERSDPYAGLGHPDIRRLHEVVEYDTEDFWSSFGIRAAEEQFAARWRGNLTIDEGGLYIFRFEGSGNRQLWLNKHGNTWDQAHIFEHGEYISDLSPGTYELNFTYVHTNGTPGVELQYHGPDTDDQHRIIPRTKTSATMVGARCDTLTCADGLVWKPNQTTLLCAGTPCDVNVDMPACCARKFKKVAAGQAQTCALDINGRPVCWGSWHGHNEQWKCHPGPFLDISTFDQYTCAVYDPEAVQFPGSEDPNHGRQVECWMHDSGNTPAVDFSEGGEFMGVAVGGQHACALRSSGFLACKGDNSHHQLAAPGYEFSSVTSGENFLCGIIGKGPHKDKLKCWGEGSVGQTGNPEDATFKQVAAGRQHACGVTTTNRLHCWGNNMNGQALPPDGDQFDKVAAGDSHTCALKVDGIVVCWGANTQSQATPPEDGGPFSDLALGSHHSCAIAKHEGHMVCWGWNYKEDGYGGITWTGQASVPPAVDWMSYRAGVTCQ